MNQAIIASPNYPNNYAPNTNCVWEIVTEKGTYIEIVFRDFDVPSSEDCSQDNVVVFDGNLNGGIVIGTFCNSRHPGGSYVRSSFNILTVTLRGYPVGIRGYGFMAEYLAAVFADEKKMVTNRTGEPLTGKSRFQVYLARSSYVNNNLTFS